MIKMKRFLFTSLLAVLILCFLCTVNAAVSEKVPEFRPIAEVMIGSSGIHWMPGVSYRELVLNVSGPDGKVFSKTFAAGSTVYLDLTSLNGGSILDGQYTYELRVIPGTAAKVRKSPELAGLDKRLSPAERALTQTGSFLVRGGAIVIPGGAPEELDRTQDVLHYDDVIITGSLCVGFDCVNGESFGYCTVKLKENNLQLCFEDTSVGSFPTNDWKIQINDTTSGGASYFTLWDTDAGRRPFTIEAGAPAHSLYVEDYGRVGLGTSIPYVELHIVDGDSPTIRLDQDGSSGWAAQRWDLCGNETNFFIRDVTNGSKLCFRIQPNTPSNTLCMRSTGYVGIGTWSPAYPLEVETTGENAEIAVERTSGATNFISAGSSFGFFGTTTNHPLRMNVYGNWKMQLNVDNSLDMANGAECDTTGHWNDASSREYKENIRNLSIDEAINTLTGLEPVKFNYKTDKTKEYAGFIAEDVPELVATKSRKTLSSLDILAVLTKVIKEQQKFIREQQEINAQLKKRIVELEKK